VTVAEAGTFIFASRSTGPAEARIFRCRNSVPLAALPAVRTGHVLEAVGEAYPQFIPVPNVLHTSLDNMGAIFHPALTLLNAGWIGRTRGDFQFYIDGVTRSTARVLGVLDRERVTVAAALGVRARPALRWLKDAYSAEGPTLYEAIQANPGYQGIKAPRNLRHRYIFEDVPFSLVPMISLGKQFGVDTWAIDAIVRLACVTHDTNYFERGRTTEDMGLKGLRVSEMMRYVSEGQVNPVYDLAGRRNGGKRECTAEPVKCQIASGAAISNRKHYKGVAI
jgi:opine dehydrogenase